MTEETTNETASEPNENSWMSLNKRIEEQIGDAIGEPSNENIVGRIDEGVGEGINERVDGLIDEYIGNTNTIESTNEPSNTISAKEIKKPLEEPARETIRELMDGSTNKPTQKGLSTIPTH